MATSGSRADASRSAMKKRSTTLDAPMNPDTMPYARRPPPTKPRPRANQEAASSRADGWVCVTLEAARTPRSGGPALRDRAIHEEHDDRPDHRDDDALRIDSRDIALAEYRLGKVAADDRSDDTEDDGPDHPFA